MIEIETKTGNLLNVERGHIVHGCNAQGVMGSGVALAVKQKYPEVFKDYVERHAKSTPDEPGLVLGDAYAVTVKNNELVIWNAITQNLYGTGHRQVNYDAVETCFAKINNLIGQYKDYFPTEVHIPLIGAGRGGGNWEIIREIIEQTMDYPVTLWLPDNTVTTK